MEAHKVCINLDLDLFEELKEWALAHDLNISQLVRRLVQEFLTNEGIC